MTEGLQNLVKGSEYPNLHITFVTAPSGPPSINNEEDAQESLKHCKPLFTDNILDQYDAFIVACYSDHPLVTYLRQQIQLRENSNAARSREQKVIGIFEASVQRSLQLIAGDQKYGIVSTGVYWEKALSQGIKSMDISGAEARFAGVATTGLNATELHDQPADEVRSRLKDAAKRLLRQGPIGAICLGCAGMAGMDETVREACEEEVGQMKAAHIAIVDGVVAALDLIVEMYK